MGPQRYTKEETTTQVKFAQWADDTEWYNTSEGEGDLDELLGDYDWDPDGDQSRLPLFTPIYEGVWDIPWEYGNSKPCKPPT